MELEQKIKIMAESKMFGITKLIRFGSSYGIVVPRLWLEMHATAIDGDYYVSLDVSDENATLAFRPINPEDIEAVSIKEKKT